MAKHTPGPWREVKYSVNSSTWSIEIHAPSGLAFELVRDCEDEDDYNEHVANARLIAAAPELLEALEALLDIADFATDPHERDIHSRARAAVRKAKGEE